MNLYLVSGGAGSGKSAWAEERTVRRSGVSGGRLVYLATMHRSSDPETMERIARHRRLRAGKGFLTIEKESHLSELLPLIRPGDQILLEDLGNLLANELFTPSPRNEGEIFADLESLAKAAGEAGSLTVVTDEVGCDGAAYAPETVGYIRRLGRLNAALAGASRAVLRLVAGIPVVIKDEEEKEEKGGTECVR